MVEGVVKRWLSGKGYGFIGCDEYNEDVFVHNSEIKDAEFLKEGQKVRFDVQDSPKGPRAVNLEIVAE